MSDKEIKQESVEIDVPSPKRAKGEIQIEQDECSEAEQRAVIRFLWASGLKANDIRKEMLTVYGLFLTHDEVMQHVDKNNINNEELSSSSSNTYRKKYTKPKKVKFSYNNKHSKKSKISKEKSSSSSTTITGNVKQDAVTISDKNANNLDKKCSRCVGEDCKCSLKLYQQEKETRGKSETQHQKTREIIDNAKCSRVAGQVKK